VYFFLSPEKRQFALTLSFHVTVVVTGVMFAASANFSGSVTRSRFRYDFVVF